MADLKSVKALFSTNFFRVPDYQRGYAWKNEQLNDLWGDIESLPRGGKHYMGALYVDACREGLANSDKWVEDGCFLDVIDGQQRLTTLAILLFVLIKHSEGKGYLKTSKEDLEKTYICQRDCSASSVVAYKFCYDERQNVRGYREFLLREIFEDSTAPRVGLKTLYTSNLVAAKKYFEEKVGKLSYEEKERIFRIVVNDLRFDFQTISSEFDVQLVFETMNNRGKPLTTLEKLKNRLIYLTEKIGAPEGQKDYLRENINGVWGTIYEKLSVDPENPLDEDEFLAAHLSLYRRPKESVFSVKDAETKLFKMFSCAANRFERNSDPREGSEPLVTYEKIVRYVHDLREFLDVWVEIHRCSGWDQKILLLNSSREVKILLCAINRLPEREDGKRWLERILFRNSVPGAWLKDDGSFATLARELYFRKDEIDKIDQITINQAVESWRKDWEMSPVNAESVSQAFSRLYDYERGPKGFHRWWGLKYFLFAYEESLVANTTEKNPRVTLDRYGATSIEHIMPQTYHKTSWDKEMNEFLSLLKNPEVHKDAVKTILNSLGNLTILGARTNSSVQNDSWSGGQGKREKYKEGSFSELEISQKESWSYREILERGVDLLNFLSDKLGMAHLAEEQLKKALLFRPEIYDSISLVRMA